MFKLFLFAINHETCTLVVKVDMCRGFDTIRDLGTTCTLAHCVSGKYETSTVSHLKSLSNRDPQ